MRDAVSADDIEALEWLARAPEAHRTAAQTLTSWATEPHPDDDVSPADLLCAAAWHLGQAEDTEASLEMYRRAVAVGGTATLDARVQLAGALFEAGREAEARQVADEFRLSKPRLLDLAAMAENFELVGDLGQAHRWVNIGVNRLQLVDDIDATAHDHEIEELIHTRRRIREALGYPADDLDRP